jgi:hypothetical protein
MSTVPWLLTYGTTTFFKRKTKFGSVAHPFNFRVCDSLRINHCLYEYRSR